MIFRAIAILFLAMAPLRASSQSTPFSATNGVNSILLDLLGDTRGFSATARFTVNQSSQSNHLDMRMEFKYPKGKMRADINMGNVQSAGLRPSMVASLKEIGMDRVITITDPLADHTLVIYPGLQAYVNAPPVANRAPVKYTKKRLGKKILDGHLCDHYLLAQRSPASTGKPARIEIWEAPDLGDFPMQIRLHQEHTIATVLYRDVSLTLPSNNEFQAPADFKAFASMENVMAEAVEKLLGQPKPANKPPLEAK